MINLGFWEKLKKPIFCMAPMACVTDCAFRKIITKYGKPDIFWTEFVSADGLAHPKAREKLLIDLKFSKNEKPIVAQIFGANSENIKKASAFCRKLGFDGIDINMGCPDKSVEKQGAGAILIKNPKLAIEITKETIRGSGGLPVSVKTRLGYDKIDYDWFKYLLSTDIAAISIHARTRKEMSKVPAHWDELGKISEMAKGSGKLIIGNGDVLNMEDVGEKARKYNLDGVMIGRGIFQNPWFFSGKEVSDPRERINLLLKHLDNFEKLWLSSRGRKNFDAMKRFFKIYINGWAGAKELRAKLMMARNKEEALKLLTP